MNFCWYHQRIIKWNLGAGELPPATARHLRHCAQCGSAQAEALALTSALNSSRFEIEPSPCLASRIKANLPRTSPKGFQFAWAKITAVALFVVVTGIIFFQMQPDPEKSRQAANSIPQQAQPSDLQIPQLPQVAFFSKKMDDPMELEIQRVIQDTRQAYQYVASNFMPSNRD